MKKILLISLFMLFAIIISGCNTKPNTLIMPDDTDSHSGNSEDIIFSTQHPVYGNDINMITCFIQNNTDKEYMYGAPYSVERLINGEWQKIPFLGDGVWFTIGYMLKPNSMNTTYVNLSACDYTFTDGTYRINKKIGDNYYYAEFELGKSNITASTPYGFQELEKIKADYTPQQAIADGAVVIEHNEIKNMEMADKFISDVSKNAPSLLRILQYTVEGDPIITDITFNVSYFTQRINTMLDRFNGQQGIHETIYSYLVTDGKDIYLSNHSSWDENSRENVRLIPTSSLPEWENAVNLIKQVTEDRLSSNITTYKVFSSDGTKYFIMSKEPLEFGYGNQHSSETGNIENKMGIAVEINEVLWADNNTILIVCKTNSDMKYYEFFNVETKSVVSYTASMHDYSIVDGEILIPE